MYRKSFYKNAFKIRKKEIVGGQEWNYSRKSHMHKLVKN